MQRGRNEGQSTKKGVKPHAALRRSTIRHSVMWPTVHTMNDGLSNEPPVVLSHLEHWCPTSCPWQSRSGSRSVGHRLCQHRTSRWGLHHRDLPLGAVVTREAAKPQARRTRWGQPARPPCTGCCQIPTFPIAAGGSRKQAKEPRQLSRGGQCAM